MATRIFSVNPGEPSTLVVESVGPTGTSGIIALVVDAGVTITGIAGAAQQASKADVLKSLEALTEYIIRKNTWPPA